MVSYKPQAGLNELAFTTHRGRRSKPIGKITCPTGGHTSRTGSNGNPHPPAPDARASAVTARAPAQVALAL